MENVQVISAEDQAELSRLAQELLTATQETDKTLGELKEIHSDVSQVAK